jgi:hypothetical protein
MPRHFVEMLIPQRFRYHEATEAIYLVSEPSTPEDWIDVLGYLSWR